MEEGKNPQEEFAARIQKYLADRAGCPTMIIANTPMGMEIQCNFVDFAMQMGILDVAKMTTAMAFERQARATVANGQSEAMIKSIMESIEEKKKVN